MNTVPSQQGVDVLFFGVLYRVDFLLDLLWWVVHCEQLLDWMLSREVRKLTKGEVTDSRARKVYYDRKGGTSVPLAKPQRKQTDTETKKQLRKVAKDFKTNPG